jgi:hypothetical protein
MYYDKFIYSIKESIEQKTAISEELNKFYLTVSPFKNSLYGISTTLSKLEIPLTKTVNYQTVKVLQSIIYLVCKSNILSLVYEEDYTQSSGTKLMVIEVDQSKVYSNVFDMRQRGGGLSETEDDNYDLLDIGNIYGKSYRKAGTIVITLPKRLEQYKDLILKAINKHRAGEEYPIILFEEE